jgi:alkaline phosphatase D
VLTRRNFTVAMLAATSGCAGRSDGSRLAADPFTLGVASGYPRTDGMVLWTRLAPQPLAPGGGISPAASIPVRWELAADDRFQRIVAAGTESATAAFAHSVHVEPRGLAAGRPYWYRFRVGDAVSPVGRTATAPPAGPLERLQLAVGSCQQYEHGYYAAYREVAEDPPDLFLHLGDYIYELSWGVNPVRRHDAAECRTLDDYRRRHALYRLDPDLQAAHAACPWLLTWDDHEVDNDYAGLLSEQGESIASFRARRAAAYRAYYEHLPLPRRVGLSGDSPQLYARRRFGDLAQVVMLDGRQYRSPQPCLPEGRSGGRTTFCDSLGDPGRSMLGAAQEAWLSARLGDGGTRWNLLAQQTVMTRLDEQPGPGEKFWTDSWNGYPAARDRLLGAVASQRSGDTLVLSGDIHAFGAARLRTSAPESPVVASEFITSSITSQGVANKLAGQTQGENPDLLYGDATRRGFLRLNVTTTRVEVAMVGFESVASRAAQSAVARRFVVEAGQPGPVPA